MLLHDAINAYVVEQNPQVKAALLRVCNAKYRAEMGFPTTPKVNTTPNADEVYHGKYTGKIAMIKAHRTRTGLGLVDSKQICEDYFAQRGWEFYGTNQYVH